MSTPTTTPYDVTPSARPRRAERRWPTVALFVAVLAVALVAGILTGRANSSPAPVEPVSIEAAPHAPSSS